LNEKLLNHSTWLSALNGQFGAKIARLRFLLPAQNLICTLFFISPNYCQKLRLGWDSQGKIGDYISGFEFDCVKRFYWQSTLESFAEQDAGHASQFSSML